MRRLPLLLRIVRARPRLFSSGAIAILVIAMLSLVTPWRQPTRLLTGWDTAVAVYLMLALHMMATSSVDRIRQRAAQEDEGQITILVLTVTAALASLAAIFAELGGAGGARQPAQLVLATVTILLSWTFIHTIFALHYAHEFYDETTGGGMAFPGGDAEPDYWDFAYFSSSG